MLINGASYERELALHAVARGGGYLHGAGKQDLWFCFQTELLTSPHVADAIGFTVFTMILFLLTYWESKPGSEALVIIGLQIICFFALNPFLISLTDCGATRSCIEEADALMHCSVQTNLALKALLTLFMKLVISSICYGFLVVCLNTDVTYQAGMWASMLFDSASLELPFICFGLYSKQVRCRSCRSSRRSRSSS